VGAADGATIACQEAKVSLGDFISKQFIRVIQWNENGDGVLAYRYPMQDMEIENGGQLTVRETQMAAFINEGRIADVFGPGLHRLTTRNLPILTDLLNWSKDFESPFKSDVYFFSTRLQIDQKWGTGTPVTIRDKEFGAVRLRAYGTYAYRLADPRVFFTKVSGTRDVYYVADLEDQLRAMIVERMASSFAESNVSFLDMAQNQSALAQKIADAMKPGFAALGLEMNQFVVESVSLPEELQKVMDQRIGMNMAGDMGRLTQFETAESLEEAAQNPGGTAGIGVGLGAGVAMAQALMGQGLPGQARGGVATTAGTKFCTECGKPVSAGAKFCGECGKQQ
jgi:membrane protease subunit (stomatin/prohibitin family)